MTETVIIEFIASTDGLQPAEDKLASLGKIDKAAADTFKKSNAELSNRVKELNAVGAATQKISQETGKTKTTIADLDKVTKGFTKSFMEGFEEGVIDTLKEAGVSSEQFAAALKKGQAATEKSTVSLKVQLKQLTEQLALLKLQGKDNTEQYRKLSQEAAHLKDTLGDVGAEIRNMGSDTAAVDGLLDIAGGLAGAFAVAQGAVALFGDENEELQEVLLRVNAAMAILQGLQQIQRVLLKESAALKFLDTTATKAQAAAQVLFATVVGKSTGALKVFRIALATTGIGLILILIGTLISQLDIFTGTTKASARATKEFSDALDGLRASSDQAIQSVKDKTEIILAQMEAAGVKRSAVVIEAFKRNAALMQAIDSEILASKRRESSIRGELSKIDSQVEREEANKQLETELEKQGELRKMRASAQREITLDLIKRQAAVREEAKSAADEAKRIEDKRVADAKAATLARLNDELAALELRKLKVAANTQQEVDLQKDILAKKAEIELQGEKLTINQIRLIRANALNDQLVLQTEFNKKVTLAELESQISRNNALLESVEITSEERLRLLIENLNVQAQIEVQAAEGNALKIKEINAKRDGEVKAARLKALQEELEYEITLHEKRSAANLRALQRIASDENATLMQRLAAIEEINNYELIKIDSRVNALNDSFSQGLIGLREYNLLYATLLDEQTKLFEDGEGKKQDAIDKTNEAAQESAKRAINSYIEVASQVVGLLDSLFKLQSDKENARISEQKARVEELRSSGAITEKEAIKRMQAIEVEEKKIKQKQAQRDKQIALFQAIINTAAGIAKAIPNIALMAIAAAFGAAQIAIIAARPIPKFRKGKKDAYEGLGEVGEAGAEIVEKSGRMYIVEKPTVVWLGKKDKVYTPEETHRKLMINRQPIYQGASLHVNTPERIDYRKLAQAIKNSGLAIDVGDQVAKKTPQPILNITEKGISHAAKTGIQKTEYLDKRRGF